MHGPMNIKKKQFFSFALLHSQSLKYLDYIVCTIFVLKSPSKNTELSNRLKLLARQMFLPIPHQLCAPECFVCRQYPHIFPPFSTATFPDYLKVRFSDNRPPCILLNFLPATLLLYVSQTPLLIQRRLSGLGFQKTFFFILIKSGTNFLSSLPWNF